MALFIKLFSSSDDSFFNIFSVGMESCNRTESFLISQAKIEFGMRYNNKIDIDTRIMLADTFYNLFKILSITQLVGVALTPSQVHIDFPCRCSTTALINGNCTCGGF